MSRNVIVKILTQSDQVATSVPFGGKIVTLVSQTAGAPAIAPITIKPNDVPGGAYAATFPDVPADTYVATSQDIDTNGNPVGAPVSSQPYTVVDLPATQAYDVTISIGASSAAQ